MAMPYYSSSELGTTLIYVNRYKYLEELEKGFNSLTKEKALVEGSLVESRCINNSLEENLIEERKAVINLSNEVERLNIIQRNQEARMLSMHSISDERWRRADKFKKEAEELKLRLSSYITRNYDLSADVSKAKCELGKANEEIAKLKISNDSLTNSRCSFFEVDKLNQKNLNQYNKIQTMRAELEGKSEECSKLKEDLDALKLELTDVTEKHDDAVSHLLLAVKLSGDIKVSEHVYNSRGDRDGEVVIFKDTASGVCKLHYEPKKVMVPKTEEDMELEDIYDKIEALKRRRQTIYALKEQRANK
jgi:chromosome segregation ATPase